MADRQGTEIVILNMKMKIVTIAALILAAAGGAFAQTRQPSQPSRAFIVKSKQQVDDITSALYKKPGNTTDDILAAAGTQARIAIFHDEKRVNDKHEVHDASDDIYYVTNGSATLMLGGSLVSPQEISPGEWRSDSASGGQSVTIKKGDVVFVPRGTPHQRTVTDKKFTMVIIKVFAETQPAAK
jgi:mannose-6-phosphate isomerase-like protein (cupin superfamily)